MPRPKGLAKTGGKQKGYKAPKTLEKEAAREALRQIVLREMESMTAAQVAHAKGVKYLVMRDKAGKFVPVTEAQAAMLTGDEIVEVWEKEPSTQAYKDLMDRAIDKPKEQEQDVNLHAEVVIKWADE